MTEPYALLLLSLSTGLLGLIAGGVLTTIGERVPLVMEREWRRSCREFLGLAETPEVDSSSIMTVSCRGCGVRRAVVSWPLSLCAACGRRPPAAGSLVCALGSAACAARFGWGLELLAALVLTWALLVLAVIDLTASLLPDDVTLPLLWAGLALSLMPVFVDARSALIGAITGYSVMWAIQRSYQTLTGLESVGQGDFKMMAALGAWMGWQSLPAIVLIASAAGAAVGVARLVRGHQRSTTESPFGPYIAVAGWLYLVAGNWIDPLLFCNGRL